MAKLIKRISLTAALDAEPIDSTPRANVATLPVRNRLTWEVRPNSGAPPYDLDLTPFADGTAEFSGRRA